MSVLCLALKRLACFCFSFYASVVTVRRACPGPRRMTHLEESHLPICKFQGQQSLSCPQRQEEAQLTWAVDPDNHTPTDPSRALCATETLVAGHTARAGMRALHQSKRSGQPLQGTADTPCPFRTARTSPLLPTQPPGKPGLNLSVETQVPAPGSHLSFPEQAEGSHLTLARF